ncbi:uncharacterized protein IWZ02DRAFT_445891 [Phyllosticta citriasiana]|uniref:uncharacterized protein n=1 Tax=Phyllosticta citriasiana TaxID=595635 RepID=UPI0030FDA28D
MPMMFCASCDKGDFQPVATLRRVRRTMSCSGLKFLVAFFVPGVLAGVLEGVFGASFTGVSAGASSWSWAGSLASSWSSSTTAVFLFLVAALPRGLVTLPEEFEAALDVVLEATLDLGSALGLVVVARLRVAGAAGIGGCDSASCDELSWAVRRERRRVLGGLKPVGGEIGCVLRGAILDRGVKGAGKMEGGVATWSRSGWKSRWKGGG